jgi:cell division protein FtsB
MPAQRLALHKRFLRFRWLLLINLVLVAVLGMSLGREYMRSRDIQTQIDELTAQAEALQAHNLELTELATAFQTESYLEREARLKLGLKKPGETVVIVQEEQGRSISTNDQGKQNASEVPSSDPRAALTQEQGALMALANPWKWWYYFFDQSRYQQMLSYGRTGTTTAY